MSPIRGCTFIRFYAPILGRTPRRPAGVGMEEDRYPGRWIRLMADFGAFGVWDKDGRAEVVDGLPISDDLKSDIEGWSDWFDSDCDFGMPNPRSFPRALFAKAGLLLAKRLKTELPPEWTVVYHDMEKADGWDKDIPKSAYEYEIHLEP